MENKFYIGIIISLATFLFGFFVQDGGVLINDGWEYISLLYPLIIIIYMTFSFEMTRFNFNLMSIILIIPFVFSYFQGGNIITFFMTIFYAIVYLILLFKFNTKKESIEENKVPINLSSKKSLLKIAIIIVDLLLLLFLILYWIF